MYRVAQEADWGDVGPWFRFVRVSRAKGAGSSVSALDPSSMISRAGILYLQGRRLNPSRQNGEPPVSLLLDVARDAGDKASTLLEAALEL